MRVSKRFPLAVHTLLFVAVLSPKRRVTSALVAESTRANSVTVRNIFLKLAEAGIVVTEAGKNGGVKLARSAESISLWDIYQAVETNDAEEIFKLHETESDCPVGKNLYTVLYPHVSEAINVMAEEMGKVTLSSLIDELKDLLKAQGNFPPKPLW